MMDMNVFRAYFRPSYYILHPIKFFKHVWWDLKGAYRRIKYGYAYIDSNEFCEWFLNIVPAMLRSVANGDSYPGVEPFETYEKWQSYLTNLATRFEELQEENWEKQNEYADEFFRISEIMRHEERLENGGLRITWSDEPDYEVLTKKYFDRCKELNDEWYIEAEKVGSMLFHMIPSLWD